MNQRAKDGIKQFLQALSVDTEAPELEKTPSRVTELYGELFSGVGMDTKSAWGDTFTADYKGLVALSGIPFYSMCEHHLLPFFGTVDIVYQPKDGCVAGLSKFQDVVNILSRRPQLQERLTSELADAIMDDLSAHGVFVRITSTQLCMLIKGTMQQDSKVITLESRGVLDETGTPDSFSDGGQFNTPQTAVDHVKQMIRDGADIIDLGVESTRPGATPLTADEEISRLSELLEPVLNASTVPVSIDTYHAKTADYAFSKGAHIINDVWGLHYDPDMAAVAAQYKVPIIIMHNSNDTNYGDIIEDMKAFFFAAIDKAMKEGVLPQQIWIDPGIGFGKTEEQNIEVIQRLGELTAYEYPVLLAPSRKRFIGSILGGLPPEERDEGTVAACITGVFQGVDMVRVHNVRMHKRALAVADSLLRGE